MLVDMKNEHKHEVNQEEFQLYPSQRRLDSENREEVRTFRTGAFRTGTFRTGTFRTGTFRTQPRTFRTQIF